jgi:16S rRNA (guanine1516-N2)-methyltransferase
MKAAFASVRQRVVLKWPLHAHAMEGLRKRSHQIIGKTTRYDVFMIQPCRESAWAATPINIVNL